MFKSLTLQDVTLATINGLIPRPWDGDVGVRHNKQDRYVAALSQTPPWLSLTQSQKGSEGLNYTFQNFRSH